MNKVKRRRRIHDTARESMGRRVRKKLLSRTLWYKGRKSTDDRSRRTTKPKGEVPTKARAVLFIEQTPGGE